MNKRGSEEGQRPNKDAEEQERQVATALLINWGPALLWMAVIFWFSAQPDLPSAPSALIDLVLKKGAHLSVYALLAVLYRRALERTRCLPREDRVAWPGSPSPAALVLSVLYAISDEWHQSFTPGRNPALLDLLIDVAGALIGLFLWQLGQHLHHWLDRNRGKELSLARPRAAHLDEL